MNTLHKIILAVLAGIVLVFIGGGTPAQGTAVTSYETAWSPEMNKASYWSNFFGMTCRKYENHNGNIAAKYDAAVVKDGSSVVKVYPDLSGVGNFKVTGAINPANGKPYSAPHSWVMKCDAPQPPPTTTVPETTVPDTTVPETTVPETTVPETTVPETTVPETTVPETTVPEPTPTFVVCVDTFDNDNPGGCGPVPEDTPVPQDTPMLPETGSETLLAWIAAILLVGGLALTGAARRNRNL